MSGLLRALSFVGINSTYKAVPPGISQETRTFANDYLFTARWRVQFQENTTYRHEVIIKSYPGWRYPNWNVTGAGIYGSSLNLEMRTSPLTPQLPKEGSDSQTMTRFYQGTVCRLLIADLTAQMNEIETEVNKTSGARLNANMLDTAAKLDHLAITISELSQVVEHYRAAAPVANKVSGASGVMGIAEVQSTSEVSEAKVASAPPLSLAGQKQG
jgi:hypothetical protein